MLSFIVEKVKNFQRYSDSARFNTRAKKKIYN